MSRLWSLSQNHAGNSDNLEQDMIPHGIWNILRNRGFSDWEEILEFLKPSLFTFHSPDLFKDMTKVVLRLAKALQNKEKVLIYGDYDADGVTGTALIYKALKKFGFQVVVHIPTRDEGYGLHKEVISKAAENGISLMVTVDCGITAVEEVALAASFHMDVIITDHHEPQEQLPAALGILNPKVADSGYPFRDLAGVGVAFKLIQALFKQLNFPFHMVGSELDYLDLAALGTIADIVPLTGENRLIVKYGLQVMEKTKHKGMQAILEECGLGGKQLKAGQISFIVAPRINAAGRMDTARLALNLFLEDEYENAQEIAKDLGKENYQRQQIEKDIFQEAEQLLAEGPLPEVIVLSSPNWHHGVIGIVASRLVERFHRPVYLISEEDEIAKGSARGIPGYHVLDELTKQGVFLTKFGGHKQAAGFSLATNNIKFLREGLNRSLRESELSYREEFTVDAVVPLEDIDIDLQKDLELLAPFGAGNPAPVLMTGNLSIKNIYTMGKKGEHLKLLLEAGNCLLESLAFKKGHEAEQLKNYSKIDIIYYLEINDYLGQEKIQAVLKDYRPSSGESLPEAACTVDGESAGPECLESIREERLQSANDGSGKLTREMLIDFYKELRFQAAENTIFNWQPRAEDSTKQIKMLKVFEELGLVNWLGGTGPGPFLIMLNMEKKTDLQLSLRFKNSVNKP